MARIKYDLGIAELTSVTGYETLDMFSRGDIDGGYGAGATVRAGLHPVLLGDRRTVSRTSTSSPRSCGYASNTGGTLH